MAGYQLETSQCMLAIHVQQIVSPPSVVMHLLATSFFISCVTCLWDVVGNFLGNPVRAQHAHSTGHCDDLALSGVSVMCNHFK